VEEKISKRLSIFPALPEVASKLLEMLHDRNVDEYQLIAFIEGEEGMTTSLLNMTNQAMFGESKLDSLGEMMDMLGLPRLRSVILTYAVNRLYAESGAARGRTTGLSTKISWDHAISVALIAIGLARRVKYPRLEEILLAGLIHDIGRLVMMINVPSEYSELLGEIYGEVVNIADVERARIGFTHEEAGALLVSRWNLPDAILAVTQFHHSCDQATEFQTPVHLLALADQIALLLGTSFERGAEIDPESNSSLYYLKLSLADLDSVKAGYQERIDAFKAVFQK
jgi:HD-like signal output (HDOD) protein